MDFQEIWHRFEKVAPVLIVAWLAFYILRCFVTGHIQTLNEFDDFLMGLLKFIFT
jgi:hypothetical protein